jgi:hypothetical protein
VKRALWIVWTYAIIYNAYGTWIWGHGLLRYLTEVGLPISLHTLYSYAMVCGPIVSFIALLWAPPWCPKKKHSN